MTLERKRYLLTTHLVQIEAMVGLPVGVVDTQGYGWRDAVHRAGPRLLVGAT